ncbi:MAG TPA: hypothetical protein VNH84_20395, partial [Candidatus Saccharimonadales bacterium]|nr:hypothetical protein [Candidatus Saccharimonadales bacterium]
MNKPVSRCRANHYLQLLAFLCLSALGVLWLGGCSQTLDKTTNLPRSARFGEAENLSEERALAL